MHGNIERMFVYGEWDSTGQGDPSDQIDKVIDVSKLPNPIHMYGI